MASLVKSSMKMYNFLCNPAKVYFISSLLIIIYMISMNLSNARMYSIGNYTVNLKHNNYLLLLVEIVYVLIWTFALNELCKNGWKYMSWVLVLFPILLMFVFIGVFLLANI
jgi:hypothetical protein